MAEDQQTVPDDTGADSNTTNSTQNPSQTQTERTGNQAKAQTGKQAGKKGQRQRSSGGQQGGGAFSKPCVDVTIKLHSHVAQRVYERGFDNANAAMYLLSVVLPIYVDNQQAGQVLEIIDNDLKEIRDGLEAEKARIEQIANEHGVDAGAAGFTNPREITAQVTNPRANHYLGLIHELDQVVSMMSVMWLSGVYTDNQYNTGSYQWQRRMIRLANRIRTLAQRAMAMARRTDNREAFDALIDQEGGAPKGEDASASQQTSETVSESSA